MHRDRSLSRLATVVAVLVAVGAVGSVAHADATRDYRRLCRSCHGDAGAGDGPAARAMPVPLPDFRSAEYQQSRSDEALTRAIREGGRYMQSFERSLDAERIDALVAYLRGLAER